jgi:DNA-binding response OmpR family regulator
LRKNGSWPPLKESPIPKSFKASKYLFVEDQPLVSEILTDLLRRYDHPTHAGSGRDALEQIKQKAPDVILLDLTLPDMNGLDVCRNEKTSCIPILAMSGTPIDEKKCLEMGCNDFILKPFSVSSLLVRLSALIP